ncbi:hypothetical protein [Algisphaera agarilytica]|nr:hypothetical protein [Algisphaera agarilytica]
MELEAAAPLFALYDVMGRAGVEFDPRFAEAFEHWRESEQSRHDDGHDHDLGRSVDDLPWVK